jgi:hypothetical protein
MSGEAGDGLPSPAFDQVLDMALLAQAPVYTDKDFDSLRLRLQNLVRSVFPDWTDFNVTSFGNLLVELYAFVGDVLTFYQDNQARESRIATATQRKNLLALTKLLGFRPAGARAATADALFTLAAVPAAPVTIPRGTRVRTASVTEPVVFQLLDDVTIPAGASPPAATGTVEHSEAQEELFASTGLPNQEVALPAAPFLDGSAIVSAGNGAYTEVANFLGSTATDRHVAVIVDQNDRATLRFGNGTSGVLPSGTITVRYKTGGGAKGNVNAGTLTKLDGSFTDDKGAPVSVSVTNPQPASGGADRQTIAQIKALAPESIRVLNRTVSREDFEINARRLPEVARPDADIERGCRHSGEHRHPLRHPPGRGPAEPGAQGRCEAPGHRRFPEHAHVPGLGAGLELPAHRRAGDSLFAPGRQRQRRAHRHPEGARRLLRGLAPRRHAESQRRLRLLPERR